MPVDSDPETGKIEIGQDTLTQLNTLRKWTMFLAVSGFTFLGLIIALGLITSTFLTTFNQSDKTPGIPDALVYATFILLLLITYFPVLFLFRFSKRASKAITTLDRKELHIAIKYLKRFFIYTGVLLILVLAGYITGLILAGTSATFLQWFIK
jgi:hypothetical protein